MFILGARAVRDRSDREGRKARTDVGQGREEGQDRRETDDLLKGRQGRAVRSEFSVERNETETGK